MSSSARAFCDRAFAAGVAGELSGGRAVALCSVLGTRGSAPRHAGARMAVFEGGECMGTIGGGALELRAQRACRDLIDVTRSRKAGGVRRAFLEWVSSGDIGMVCGGEVLVAYRLLDTHDIVVLDSLAFDCDEARWLVEDWSSAAGPTWDVVGEEEARALGLSCDGAAWDEGRKRYSEKRDPVPRAIVFGAGHVGSALVPVLAGVGFRVIVLDERDGLVGAGRFPSAEDCRVCDYRAVGASIALLPHDYVVIATPEHASDLAVLEQAIESDPCYIGCIGSKGKTARFRSMLEERGVSREALDRVHMPIGDPIGAATPAEIAISIAAEMIRWRAQEAK